MRIRPKDIAPSGSRLQGEEQTDILDLDPSDSVQPAGPAAYDLMIQVAVHELVASGRVSALISFQCVRCTRRFVQSVEEPDFLCSIPFASQDEEVDLTADIREAIILRLSAHPVCKADCRGLCVRCGRDLNMGPCGCSATEDHRWSALNGLRL